MNERCLHPLFQFSSNLGLYIYAGRLVRVLQRQYRGHMTIQPLLKNLHRYDLTQNVL